MAKGAAYEREICRTLSLWWTNGENDNVFWRTPGSGGRATMRTKAGKQNGVGSGDVQAIDPIGEPLLKVFTIEIKRGYNRDTIQDLMDNKTGGRYKEWIDQAERQAKAANSYSWMLITKRDRREPCVVMPQMPILLDWECPIPGRWNLGEFCMLPLNDFLSANNRAHIRWVLDKVMRAQ